MAVEQKTPRQERGEHTLQLDPAVHRRILNFLNEAVEPTDLIREKVPLPPPEGHEDEHGDGHPAAAREPQTILDPDMAEELIAFRDREYPLGFRHVKELQPIRGFHLDVLEILQHIFGYRFYGRWSVFPQPIPRRGPGTIYGVVHAALLHTGKVLFITADETTLLWNPNDTSPASFEDPVNQPHLTPDASSGYSALCSGHSFLSDGQLLVVGGGGYSSHSKAKWGYRFNPTTRTWARTTGSMVHDRWYPTVLTLGDGRVGNSREVLVVCGHGAGDMEIYDEATDSFREVTAGDTKPFPYLYPGLHLLPNNSVFYSRTGWRSPGPGGGPFPGDDQSSYFVLTGASTGAWTDIAPILPGLPDRTKGMSVLLFVKTPPTPRVLVLGGSDSSNNNSYEVIDASSLSSTTNWAPATPFPDGERRSLASAVLLPDGTVFVCGGIQRQNSPCTLFDPSANTWSPMAALSTVRDYHSVALLLPSAQVAMAGWEKASIEIFDPPYLFRGPRPVISSAPSSVQRGSAFAVGSPDAGTMDKVVLVRPMAVTHQTDTEQKVLELPYVRTGFSTFGTIDTNGAVTDRFGVGNNFDALTFASGNHGFGPNLFYFLRHDANGFSTFGTIDTNGAVTDRFGVGNNFDALTYAPPNLGFGAQLFYYLRTDITELQLTAPDGTAPHALAQKGYYMLFALNSAGVPSVARWIRLD